MRNPAAIRKNASSVMAKVSESCGNFPGYRKTTQPGEVKGAFHITWTCRCGASASLCTTALMQSSLNWAAESGKSWKLPGHRRASLAASLSPRRAETVNTNWRKGRSGADSNDTANESNTLRIFPSETHSKLLGSPSLPLCLTLLQPFSDDSPHTSANVSQ